jgi:hypothetical protein
MTLEGKWSMNTFHAQRRVDVASRPDLETRQVASGPYGNDGQALAVAPGVPMSCWEGAAYFAITAAFAVIIGLRAFPAVLEGSLVNPDSYMRLVRLREILAENAPISIVSRDASGAGAVLHWSHLLDSLILLLAAPLSLLMSEEQALHWVALAFGPTTIGLLVVALAWAVAPLTEPRWRWLMPLIAVISPGILAYAVPGVLRHQIPIGIVSVMTAGWALRAPSRGAAAGRAIGAWGAAGIWLTPETLPFIVAAFCGLGLVWLLHPENLNSGNALRAGGTTFLVLIAAALAVDPPLAGYGSAEIDRLSIMYLALGAAICTSGWTAWWLDRVGLQATWRGAAGLTTALAGFGLWSAAFPAVLAGPYGLMSARDAAIIFSINPEMQPIRTAAGAAVYVMTGVLSAIAASVIAVRTQSFVWGFAALYASLTVALGVSELRFTMYNELIGVAALPVIMSAFDCALERRPAPFFDAVRWAFVFLYLLFPESASLGNFFSADVTKAASVKLCDPRLATRVLLPYAGEVVLANPIDTPALLYWTKVLTAGSIYHRNIAAFLQGRAAWRSAPSDDMPEAVRATHAALVLVCPGGARSAFVRDLPPHTLYDQLNTGAPPQWLALVARDVTSGYVLYRVTNSGR